MIIQVAKFDDLSYILPLIVQYYEEDRSDADMPDQYIIDQTVAMLDSPAHRVLLAFDVDKIVGVAGLALESIMGKLVAQEVFWKIHDDYTKSKVGAKLLRALEQEGKAMGAEVMTVVSLAGEHEQRVGNSYTSRGYDKVYSAYTKEL